MEINTNNDTIINILRKHLKYKLIYKQNIFLSRLKCNSISARIEYLQKDLIFKYSTDFKNHRKFYFKKQRGICNFLLVQKGLSIVYKITKY